MILEYPESDGCYRTVFGVRSYPVRGNAITWATWALSIPLLWSRANHWHSLLSADTSIGSGHKPARQKRHRLVHMERLLDLGLDLLANAENKMTPYIPRSLQLAFARGSLTDADADALTKTQAADFG
jgi:hypothetical protein